MADNNNIMNTARMEYIKAMPNWIMTRAVVGLDVKSDNIKRLVYLPYPSVTPPAVGSTEFDNRYNPYILRAVLAGYAKRTIDTLVGSAFKKKPLLENLPSEMQNLIEDITGTGLSLDQLAKACERTTMITGRSGQYTSFPSMVDGSTAAQTNGVMPNVSLYHAENIPFWSDDNNLIVLMESYDKSENEFEIDNGTQLRVLRLGDSGATSQLYFDDGTEGDEIPLINGYGEQWDRIPFEWVGSANNDNVIDESLILAIAEINLAHYRNSADQEENCHIHSQTTTYFTSDLESHEIKEMLPNGIEMGARAAHFLGKNGSMDTVTANANGLVENLMLEKVNMMIQLGAKIIRDSANVTAEAVRTHAASETANLSSLTHNVSKATENSLKNCAEYLGINGDAIEYNISQEFFDSNISPEEIMAMLAMYDRKLLGAEEVQEPLRAAGKIKRTAEEIADEGNTRTLI